MVVWSAISLLTDADVVGSVMGLLAAAFRLPGWLAGILAALVPASHGVLYTLTDGGLGCALFWPFNNERLFAPWRPLPVAPIGRAFLSSVGIRVVLWEAAPSIPFLV
jgi:inner membrane protein